MKWLYDYPDVTKTGIFFISTIPSIWLDYLTQKLETQSIPTQFVGWRETEHLGTAFFTLIMQPRPAM